MRASKRDAELLDEFTGVGGVDADLCRNASVRFTNRQVSGQNDVDGLPRVPACGQVLSPDLS
jgi:hypothetical protein